MNGAAFVLAVGVPIFNYLIGTAASASEAESLVADCSIGIAASLFAAWFTYGM
jgi:hypothetical protein